MNEAVSNSLERSKEMKSFITGIVCLFSFVAYCGSSSGQQSLAGEWTGGYEIRETYTPIQVRFLSENGGLAATLDLSFRGPTGVALNQVKFVSPNLHFEWPSTTPTVFDGQLSGDFIAGNIQFGEDRGTFHLVRTPTLDAKVLDQYAGDYQIGRDRYISVQRTSIPTAGILFTERSPSNPTHRSGKLFPISETTFVTGPGRFMPYPVEIKATFVKNEQGEVTALKWNPTGGSEIIGNKVKLHLSNEEEVKFSNGDVSLAGTLSLPLTKGPHPAVVLILGSDGGSRLRGGLATFFAQHGIAALTYDKRGWDASTGTRIGATVGDMAGDASAGVQFLQRRPDINPHKVGVWAISQGGWMAPVVAATTPSVAFMILHAAPAVSPREQSRMLLVNSFSSRYGLNQDELKGAVAYQNLYLDAMNSDEAYDKLQASYEQLRARGVRWAWYSGTKEQLRSQWTRANVDFDPVPFLEKVKCPVLAFFGGKDGQVPPEGNVSVMEAALRKAGNKDVLIKVLPGVDHNFALYGKGDFGYQSSGKVPPGYYDVMISWLKKRADLP